MRPDRRARRETRFDRRDDLLADLVLQREGVRELAVVALGPEVLVGRGVDELRRHAHAIVDPAHAALDDVSAAKLARDRTGVDVASLVGKCRLPREDLEPADCLKACEDVFDQSVGEVRLGRVLGHVGKWQHCDRAGIGSRRGRRRGSRCRRCSRPRRAGIAHDVEAPGEHQRERKAEQQDDRRKRDRPFRQLERRQHHGGHLHQQPRDDGIGHRDPEDLALLEFGNQRHGRSIAQIVDHADEGARRLCLRPRRRSIGRWRPGQPAVHHRLPAVRREQLGISLEEHEQVQRAGAEAEERQAHDEERDPASLWTCFPRAPADRPLHSDAMGAVE